MFSTTEQLFEWLHGLSVVGIKPGTERMEWMLEKIDHPERRIRSVHVGGTNGKGSTVCYLRYIYQAAGLKVGTFTSPYITSFNERIMVNGVPIDDGDLLTAAEKVYPLTQAIATETDLGRPSEFEVLTMLSLVYFGRMNPCDLVIFEVGLGGRLDATNVIWPLVSVITNVAMDHMKFLGHTIADIAREKAGIIKNGVGIVTTAEHPDALAVIRHAAKARRSRLYVLGEAFKITPRGHDESGESFNFDTLYFHGKDLFVQMKGQHQLKNAAAALMAVTYLKTYFGVPAEPEEIRAGLKQAVWPGRFEQLPGKLSIVLDGAHNIAGTTALAETIGRYYPSRRVHLLYAALKDKEYKKMIPIIERAAFDITLTTFDFPRAADSHILYEASHHARRFEDADWRHALEELADRAGADDVLLVCGSLYFIAVVRRFLLQANGRELLRHGRVFR
ncbi:MAG: bifunctional folylpolyglutamate synthase/dihydrofolate synthase [Sporolactobacillus sp.]|jgi:dihydrofolate synthase/folylpolyglutamate synthase|nr:bifunctional folylpolyglutamate synthase/dihydrofolate synthase [Sporolactobacillus sp.]